MTLVLAAFGVLLASGCAALLAARQPGLSARLASVGAVIAALVGLPAALMYALRGLSTEVELDWGTLGRVVLGLDPLSAVFLVPIFVLGSLAAVYGRGYLELGHAGADHSARRNDVGPRVGAHWFFFNLLLAAMTVVVLARHAVLFLIAWEVMSVAAFFLVTFEDRDDRVRDAGWTYLVATHIGTAFLLALFLLLARASGSFDLTRIGTLPAGVASIVFVLALLGFGAKAGFFPLHVWLPDAHPAAPSHVSALLSAVMIKTGIYGILRVLTLLVPALGVPPAWWGWTLVAIGAVTGVLGVLLALGQHDIKRVLAYSSVENIGIVALGLGCGVLGVAFQAPAVAVLGFGGALLHVWNHALFKGLLFLGAGAVAHATGTRELDRLGGLAKRMPTTGGSFLLGAAAIAGVPPLNGFLGELVILLAAFSALTTLPAAGAVVPALAVIAALALISGLAVACFARVVGIAFLGKPRSAEAASAHEVTRTLRVPMIVLAALCVLVGVALPADWIVALGRAVFGGVEHVGDSSIVGFGVILLGLRLVLLVGAVVLGGLALVRRGLLIGREVGSSPTWDCGYAAPTTRMQYTASSFSAPLVELFGGLLRRRMRGERPSGMFPHATTLVTETPELVAERGYRPAFALLAALAERAHVLQEGRVQLYVLYVAVTLAALLLWGLH